MLSKPSQQKLRQKSSDILFTAQYHARMLYQDQHQKMCTSASSQSEMRSQNGGHRATTPYNAPLSASFQTAKEKFEQASSPAHSPFKKYRLEHTAPPSPFPTVEPRPAHLSLPVDFPIAIKAFSYTSPYAACSMEETRLVQGSFAVQTDKQYSDHRHFVENVPTLHLGFTLPTTLSRPAWHALTTLETTQHPIARTMTGWYTFAKQQTAQHPISKAMADWCTTQHNAQNALTKLKNSRYRTASLIGSGLVALVLIALIAQSSLAHQTLNTINTGNSSQLASSAMHNAGQQAPAQQQSPAQQQVPAQQQAPDINASKSLVRLSQLNPDEYASQDEFNLWGYSACSTTALTEVINSYGHHYRVTNVLKVESEIGEITPELGLLEDIGIARTAAKFGFATQWGDNWTYNQVIHNANAGHPVIVGWPPARYTDGHIVVVTGGDANHVYLADSSTWNRHEISRNQFMQWWGGFAAIVTPR